MLINNRNVFYPKNLFRHILGNRQKAAVLDLPRRHPVIVGLFLIDVGDALLQLLNLLKQFLLLLLQHMPALGHRLLPLAAQLQKFPDLLDAHPAAAQPL